MTARPLRFLLRPERIGAAIDQHHLSHDAFAAEIGVSRQHWSSLYNRHRALSPKVRWSILANTRLAGIPEAELFEVVAA